ncbi:amidohydrolase family protein [Ferruginibacter sp.]
MKKYAIFLCCSMFALFSNAQVTVTDSGSFFLHKFAQNIGKETYYISKKGGNTVYDVNFKFVDRGSPVPLKAQIVVGNNAEPVSLFIKGNTSRFSQIDDSITILNKKVSIRVNDSVHSESLRPVAFPVAGYSPGTVQMLLLQYWKKHKEPRSIAILPKGAVTIKKDGTDQLRFMDKDLLLDRFVISGLIWGNEIVWTDQQGKLICLITNDAEGDKLEMMSEPYESLLPELISKAAAYGMQLFTKSMKMDFAANKTIYIKGGKILDINTGNYLENKVIVVENGTIKTIASMGEVSIDNKAVVVDATGKTIIPGLWDMHAHFQQAEWGPAYLASGATTVRDCGNEFGYINSIKEAIDTHKGVGPFIIKAGIIDGPGPMGLGIVRATTAEEAIKAVRMYKDNGFAQIKIYSSVQPATVKAIADEAHRLGLTVTGHIPQGMSTQAGIDSGMDQVNHMQYVYAMMKRNADRSINLQDSQSVAALEFLKSHHTVIDPTIGVFEMVFRSTDDNLLEWEPNYYNLPLPLQSLFNTMGMPADQAQKSRPVYEGMLNLVKVLHDKGITFVAGTDMGFPGYSVARELELYVQAGLTPLQALQSATIVPAQVMHMDNISGSITVGKHADLVILDADPLTEMRNIRKVYKVVKEGQLYDPGTLRKMVGFGK